MLHLWSAYEHVSDFSLGPGQVRAAPPCSTRAVFVMDIDRRQREFEWWCLVGTSLCNQSLFVSKTLLFYWQWLQGTSGSGKKRKKYDTKEKIIWTWNGEQTYILFKFPGVSRQIHRWIMWYLQVMFNLLAHQQRQKRLHLKLLLSHISGSERQQELEEVEFQ